MDLGVRVELPAVIFSHLTDELYESKIVYRTEKFEDNVRTFCMNPNGIVVNENTNGIITVNGHSYEDPAKYTENTNFALLVSKHFSEPFKDSNGYGESIARLSNMLGGGVIVQRFGDLVRGRRSTVSRIEEGLVRPTLSATPGDLSLVLPKRILDGIIEMIYALDKIAPGTANDDTLLYGVEVKFYNMEVDIDEHLESRLQRSLYHRRRKRRYPLPVPCICQRRVCGKKNRGNFINCCLFACNCSVPSQLRAKMHLNDKNTLCDFLSLSRHSSRFRASTDFDSLLA